ncbi:S-adenosylmethionine sensor upstream of mTORC1 [Aricia agestis]|uniref:S-adenosylmethionine sensor upstream of mTORC1 n=1 Tax=Aricia agestis TaxID=91739 RepID=UPI001C208ECE|nr:S-adenosylmethionine sensor upstream of mTORC1 [Aricia agestis]
MASKEHQELAQFLKDVHLSLRKQTCAVGAETAWNEHCKDEKVLRKYAKCMEKLATTFWDENSSEERGVTVSRIKWSIDIISDYFFNKTYIKYRDREKDIGAKIGITVNNEETFLPPMKLLDVGSCYNPFRIFEFLDVIAIDLCPANGMVFKCDFLNVPIGTDNTLRNNNIEQLQENSFDVVTFCFLLEYLPTSELRIQACRNAYKLLKTEGMLVIATPDSKHVGANSKLMKCWRYSLALMGFSRIKYEKFQHMHCMAYRKSLHLNIASRWAELHQETYMSFNINIPQDFSVLEKEITDNTETPVSVEDFAELPFGPE